MRIPLAGGQNKRFSVNQDAQTLVNLYLDADSGGRNQPGDVQGAGKVVVFHCRNRPRRGHDRIRRRSFWRYRTTRFTRIDSSGNETLVGSISFPSPSVACSKTAIEAIFVTDSGAWVSNGTSLTRVTDPDYPDLWSSITSAAASFCHPRQPTVL